MLKSDKMVGYPGLLGYREGVAFCDSAGPTGYQVACAIAGS